MKSMFLLPAMLLFLASPMNENQDGVIQTYILPKPHKWDMRQTLKCKAVSSVSLHQKGLVED